MSVSVPDQQPIPDTYAPVTQSGAVLINLLAPWMTLHMAWYLDAWGAMFDPVYTLAVDTGYDDGSTPTIGTVLAGLPVVSGYAPGYSILFDPTRCPAADLPYLGQYVGVQIPTGTDTATARSLVIAEAGFKRGSVASIIAAAQRNLTGTQSVRIIERQRVDETPDPYWFVVVVRPGEVISVPALVAAVNSVKPGGLLWALVESNGYTWGQALHTWAVDTMTWDQSADTQP